MKHFAFMLKGYDGETLINLFDKEDKNSQPFVITWRFLEYGKATLLVSVVDTFGEKQMTDCATINADGEFVTKFDIVTEFDLKVTILVRYYEELNRLYIEVIED